MNNSDIREQVELIREVFAYTERFKNSTFVIKIDNDIIDHADFPQHAQDIALLQKTGIRTIIVPGARKRIDEVLNQFGIETRFVGGMRICDAESISFVKMAAFDIAHRVMSALSGHGITAVIGNWARARSKGVVGGVDYDRAGSVDRINVEAVSRSLEHGHVPIFPCVGHSENGQPLNLCSDELAGTVARALHAQKLFFLTPHPVLQATDWELSEGVKSLDDGRLFGMSPEVLSVFLAANPDIPTRKALETAAIACRGGINRAHILDGRQGGVLLHECFSNLGVGTMVYADAYEHLRPMERADVPGVLEIMRPLIAEALLVSRGQENLLDRMHDYWVYDLDGVVHGCAALHPHDREYAEIAGVAVDPRFAQLGIGMKLVARLLEKARNEGYRRVFALTTQAADWFLVQGFKEGSVSDLPTESRGKYDEKRNSRVLIRDLAS